MPPKLIRIVFRGAEIDVSMCDSQGALREWKALNGPNDRSADHRRRGS
jgi:hypothetical protein